LLVHCDEMREAVQISLCHWMWPLRITATGQMNCPCRYPDHHCAAVLQNTVQPGTNRRLLQKSPSQLYASTRQDQQVHRLRGNVRYITDKGTGQWLAEQRFQRRTGQLVEFRLMAVGGAYIRCAWHAPGKMQRKLRQTLRAEQQL